jgi:hypothetical protein
MLTPLPTYASQIIDECFSYSSSPEQNLSSFTQAMDINSFPMPGYPSPQTPEPITYHEPISIMDSFQHYATSQAWSNEALASCELGFEPNMANMLPIDVWPTPDTTDLATNHLSWSQYGISVSPQQISTELILHSDAVPITTSEYSMDGYSSDTMRGDWTIYQPTTTDMDLANMVTLTPYMHDINSGPSHGPILNDVFVPGSSSY